jgi:hypothetical protein
MSWFSLDLNKIPHIQIIAVVLVIFTSIFPPFFIISQYNPALFSNDLFKVLIIAAACGFSLVFTTVVTYIAICSMFKKSFDFLVVVLVSCFFITASYFTTHDYCFNNGCGIVQFVRRMEIKMVSLGSAIFLYNLGEVIFGKKKVVQQQPSEK